MNHQQSIEEFTFAGTILGLISYIVVILIVIIAI